MEKQQARLSLRLMECDFERWQEIIKPDYEEWSASVTQLRKYGESDLAGDLSTLISTVRVLVHTDLGRLSCKRCEILRSLRPVRSLSRTLGWLPQSVR